MLLSRLVEYAAAGDAVPPYYKPQKVRWVLELDADGSLASGILTALADPDEPSQKNGIEYMVPSITKTSGISPRIAVDTPEYLFGWVPDGGKPERVRLAHTAFREQTSEWVAADPDGPAVALHRFLSDGHAGRSPRRTAGAVVTWSRCVSTVIGLCSCTRRNRPAGSGPMSLPLGKRPGPAAFAWCAAGSGSC